LVLKLLPKRRNLLMALVRFLSAQLSGGGTEGEPGCVVAQEVVLARVVALLMPVLAK